MQPGNCFAFCSPQAYHAFAIMPVGFDGQWFWSAIMDEVRRFGFDGTGRQTIQMKFSFAERRVDRHVYATETGHILEEMGPLTWFDLELL